MVYTFSGRLFQGFGKPSLGSPNPTLFEPNGKWFYCIPYTLCTHA